MAVLWTVAGATGGKVEVEEMTLETRLLGMVSMIVGCGFYGKIFADFMRISKIRYSEERLASNLYEQMKMFCVERRLPKGIKSKIRDLFTKYVNEYTIMTTWDEVFTKLPFSLQTTLSIYSNLKYLKKIKFLGLGSLNFLLAMSR